MVHNRFSEEEIRDILQQYEAGIAASDLCERVGVAVTTFYRWRRKYRGLHRRFPGVVATGQGASPRLAVPEAFGLKGAHQLIQFLNSTNGGTVYRVVLDAEGIRLEAGVGNR